MKKLSKDRVFRHMAKDTPDFKIVWTDRDEIVRNNEFPEWFQKQFENWQRLMAIKHEDNPNLVFVTDQMYDIDFNRMRFLMEVGDRRLYGSRRIETPSA